MKTYFSRIIKAGALQREFNFLQLSGGTDKIFNVNVPDERGNRIYFQMIQDASGKWKASAQTLPLWIQGSEEDISNVIIDELSTAEK